MSLPDGWITCTVKDVDGAHVILEPEEWAGMLMLEHVHKDQCAWVMPSRPVASVKCGLPARHEGPHLACAKELLYECGTLEPVSWVDAHA